jgi:uncharacterized membrane protein
VTHLAASHELMSHTELLLSALGLALLIGIVAGLRSFTAPAVVAWAAFERAISLGDHWVAWVGSLAAVIAFTVLAAGELVLDKLPKTPSRTAPPSFGARLVSGGFAGAVIGTAFGHQWSALGAGIVGAAIGTLGGYHARARLATSFGRDLPAALLEDVVAVGGGFAIAALAAAL